MALEPGRPEPGPIVFVVHDRIGPADVPRLCERMARLLKSRSGAPVVCDVAAISDPDMVTIEGLARLQLTALRLGRRLWFRRAGARLRNLVALTGLREVLPLSED